MSSKLDMFSTDCPRGQPEITNGMNFGYPVGRHIAYSPAADENASESSKQED
jgi:hypothetical protein